VEVKVTACPVVGDVVDGVIAAVGAAEPTSTVVKTECVSRPSSTVRVAWKLPTAG
jgi:hypothetical protein